MSNSFSGCLTKPYFRPNLALIKEHLEARDDFIKYLKWSEQNRKRIDAETKQAFGKSYEVYVHSGTHRRGINNLAKPPRDSPLEDQIRINQENANSIIDTLKFIRSHNNNDWYKQTLFYLHGQMFGTA